jgi:HK97 family phage portal protein
MFGGKKNPTSQTWFELLNSYSTITKWSGNIYQSDIVRSAIRPKVNAISKLNPKHIRGSGEKMKINPDVNIKLILNKPNPYMSMQDFLMKMTWQREINHNAFAYVRRDDNGVPMEIYPVPYSSIKLIDFDGEMFFEFRFSLTGNKMTVGYADLIHLRKDFNEHDIFGDSGYNAMKDIMEVQTTTDQGIVNAVKNSAIIKWILKFKSVLQPEDVELQVDEFVKNYLSIENGGKGAAASDPRYELEQVKNDNFVPNAAQTEKTKQRIYDYFAVNDNIVQSKYSEDEWNAFYESEIEPVIIQLSNAFTNVFFTRNQQGFGNQIVFEASNLAYASMSTKLNLLQMVDRGAMTPNEWRLVLNLGAIEGGDKPIRRLDTALVDENAKKSNDDEEEAKNIEEPK